MSTTVKKFLGIILGLGGTYAVIELWPRHHGWALALALIVLSFVIEMFKTRKLGPYDWIAGLIVLVTAIYITS